MTCDQVRRAKDRCRGDAVRADGRGGRLTVVDAPPPEHHPTGRHDPHAATARNGIAIVVDANPRPGDAVTLDLSDVDFIDSSGISMLLKIRSYLDDMGCRFVLVNPSAQVVRVLTIVGLNEMFAVDDA